MSVDIRQQIAEALWAADAGTVSYTWRDVSESARAKWLRLADALLPVVDRIARARAAGELREAADRMPTTAFRNPPQDWLVNRADELDLCACPDEHCDECGCCP
jgi:hypothetical protein